MSRISLRATREITKVPLQRVRRDRDIDDFCLMPLAMDVKEVAAMLVRHANAGNEDALRYADPLASQGLSGPLREQLEQVIWDLKVTTEVRLPPSGEEWTEASVFAFNFFSGDLNQLFALATMRILVEGYERRVHKCDLKACGKIFIGDPRSRWCNPSKCGSYYRVYKRRHGAYKARRLLR